MIVVNLTSNNKGMSDTGKYTERVWRSENVCGKENGYIRIEKVRKAVCNLVTPLKLHKLENSNHEIKLQRIWSCTQWVLDKFAPVLEHSTSHQIGPYPKPYCCAHCMTCFPRHRLFMFCLQCTWCRVHCFVSAVISSCPNYRNNRDDYRKFR